MPPVITFLPNGGKPEKSNGTQIFKEGVGRRQARDEEAQGWYAEERPLGPQGQEPQAGDCDRTVGGEGQGQEGAEEGSEEAEDEEESEEVKAEGEAVATAVIASEAKQSIAPHAETWIASAFALRATADKSSLCSLAQTLRVCRRQ
jgi:hypothetical protein